MQHFLLLINGVDPFLLVGVLKVFDYILNLVNKLVGYLSVNKASTHFDEWLDLGALVDFVFAHPLVHFTGVSVDASHEGVTVGLV